VDPICQSHALAACPALGTALSHRGVGPCRQISLPRFPPIRNEPAELRTELRAKTAGEGAGTGSVLLDGLVRDRGVEFHKSELHGNQSRGVRRRTTCATDCRNPRDYADPDSSSPCIKPACNPLDSPNNGGLSPCGLFGGIDARRMWSSRYGRHPHVPLPPWLRYVLGAGEEIAAMDPHRCGRSKRNWGPQRFARDH
jgi:hypothetical protein